MKRWILAALLAACCVALIVSPSNYSVAQDAVEVACVAVVAAPADDGDVEAVNPKAIKADRMTLRERRALGLTVGNVRRIVLELREKGTTTDDPATLSLAVANQLLTENATVYSQLDPAFDWDSFMAFVEKIVELIMKLIGLFSHWSPVSYMMAA